MTSPECMPLRSTVWAVAPEKTAIQKKGQKTPIRAMFLPIFILSIIFRSVMVTTLAGSHLSPEKHPIAFFPSIVYGHEENAERKNFEIFIMPLEANFRTGREPLGCESCLE